MRKANIISASILLAFTACYAWLTWNLPVRNMEGTLGIDFMPWVLTLCLGSLSILLLITNLKNPYAHKKGGRVGRREALGIILLTALVSLYVVAIQQLGYLISTPLFLASLMIIAGARKWLEVAAVSIGATAGIYLFFNKVFLIQLPGGSL